MTERIELPEARQLLAQALATQGRDFVYKPADSLPGVPCVNVAITDELAQKMSWEVPADDPRRKTGCIAGTAITLSGRLTDADWDWLTYGTVYKFGLYLTSEAQDYLWQAQAAQDTGSTWGEAFDRAEAWVSRRFPEAGDGS